MKLFPSSQLWARARCLATAVVILALCVVSSPRWADAQEFRAVLTGQVTDASDAVLKGATVTAVNRDTGTSYSAETSNAGVYYMSYVLPGTYTVTVKATGFRSAVQDNVLLVAAQYFGLNFKLEVGAISESVTVTAAPPLIETASGSGGTDIDSRTISEVPLDGRQVYMLIGTTPGSQFTQTSFGPNGYSGTRGWDNTNAYIMGGGAPTGNFTGALGGYNQFTLDGTNITQQTTYQNQNAGAWNVSPNIDAVEEVNVMTSTYDARYSRTGGGTVNLVTKNGTNQFHGDLFEFWEGAILAANRIDFIDQGLPKQGLVQNQFGGTFGGPIVKNKLFFFGSYEGYRESIAGAITTAVPPAYLRPGNSANPAGNAVDFGLIQQNDPQDFPNGIAVFDPSTTQCGPSGTPLVGITTCDPSSLQRSEFPNDTMPASDINSIALKFINLYPLPNVAGRQNSLVNNYFASAPSLYRYDQYMARMDYNTSDKTKWYTLYEYQPGSENRSGNGLFGLAENGNVNHTRRSWTAAQDLTHVFSPTFMGDFKASFSRFADSSPDGDFAAAVNASTFGLTMPNIPTTTLKDLPECNDNNGHCMGNAGNSNFGGFTNIIGNSISNDSTNNVMLDADFTKSKGAHNIHFGGVFAEFQYGNPQSVGNANGQFNFGSANTQYNGPNASIYTVGGIEMPNGLGFADMLLGYPDGGHVDYNYTIMEGQPAWGLYAQDDWRVTHRLTLNLGLRYDVQRGLRERDNALTRGITITAVNPVTNDPTYQANIANPTNVAAWTLAGINPASLATVLGGFQYAGRNGQSRDGYNTDWSNIAPRIGFAFALNPKTVIRGGWGFMFGGGLEGGSPLGYTQSTNYPWSINNNSSVAPNAPGYPGYTGYSFATGNPYGGGIIAPQIANLGLLTEIGNGGQAIDLADRKIPKTMIMSLGIQHELPHEIVLDARFSANYASRLRVFNTLNNIATLAQVQQHIAADIATGTDNWQTPVPNPYQNVPAFAGTSCGSSTTIPGIDLLVPLGQFCGGAIYQYNDPIGKTWYDALEVKLSKRAGHGLTFNFAYTYSKTEQATSFQGVGPSNGYGDNSYSGGEFPWQYSTPTHEASDYDRTHLIALTTVWDLPVGIGPHSYFLSNPTRVLGYIVNNWSLSGIFAYGTGTPIRLPATSGYNYIGTQSLTPAGGPKYTQWINNNDGFPMGCTAGTTGCPAGGVAAAWAQDTQVGPGYTDYSPWGIGYLKDFYTQVRNPSIPNLDMTLAKKIPITESKEFEFRWDIFNAFNGHLYNGPDTNPGDTPSCQTLSATGATECTGFGNINTTQQQNFPRRMQVGLKFIF